MPPPKMLQNKLLAISDDPLTHGLRLLERLITVDCIFHSECRELLLVKPLEVFDHVASIRLVHAVSQSRCGGVQDHGIIRQRAALSGLLITLSKSGM